MKKNRMMRLASVLMVLTLLSTSVISGTFAKYVTSVSVNDEARVAYWGFDQAAITDFALFEPSDAGILGDGEGLLAPGSTDEATFAFGYTNATTPTVTAPEVDYTFTVDAEITGQYAALDANPNFYWYLEKNGVQTGTYQTVALLTAAIEDLSGEADGSKDYEAGNLPTAFSSADEVYTVGWEWEFEDADDTGTPEDETAVQDAIDTAMGNMLDLNDVKLVITITATQRT